MKLPPGWKNPITAAPSSIQQAVVAEDLLPSRADLVLERLEVQRVLLAAGQPRNTMIQVTSDGVIWDGHQGVRAAAETGSAVDVKVVNIAVKPVGMLILDLPVR